MSDPRVDSLLGALKDEHRARGGLHYQGESSFRSCRFGTGCSTCRFITEVEAQLDKEDRMESCPDCGGRPCTMGHVVESPSSEPYEERDDLAEYVSMHTTPTAKEG